MSLIILNGSAFFGLQIPLHAFPQLAQAHLNENPSTPTIESLGEDLARLDFPAQKTADFVKAVCEWGGYAGVWGRILKNNQIATIGAAFRSALSSLAIGDIAASLAQVNTVHGLGDVSFASKHLRFLRPDICAVFDSILHDALPYTFDQNGYSIFCNDCASLAKVLAENQISNPRVRKNGSWFPADVEGAVYVFARPYLRPTAIGPS